MQINCTVILDLRISFIWSIRPLTGWNMLHETQIPFGSSRHVTIRHVRRVKRVETSVSSRAVRQARHRQNALARHVERVVSCRDVTWRPKWNSGYNAESSKIVTTKNWNWILVTGGRSSSRTFSKTTALRSKRLKLLVHSATEQQRVIHVYDAKHERPESRRLCIVEQKPQLGPIIIRFEIHEERRRRRMWSIATSWSSAWLWHNVNYTAQQSAWRRHGRRS